MKKNMGQNVIHKYLNTGKKIPGLDVVVVAYVITVLLFQLLFQISPVMKFFTNTPIYSIQTYLGVLGGVLIVIDFFTNKVMWKGKYCWLLYGILVFAGLASLRVIDYGVKENLYKLCWAAIQFALVYSVAHRMDKTRFVRWMLVLYSVLLAVWVIACCVSLYQYVHQIEYWDLVNPLAKDASYSRQGFFDNRLFGIFYTLNHAAYISLLFCLIGCFVFLRTKRVMVRAAIGLSEWILLCHILLSSSRSAFVSLIACSFCIVWAFLYRNSSKTGWKKLAVPVAAAVLAAAVVGVGAGWLKDGLAKVPAIYVQMTTVAPEETEQTAHTEENQAEQTEENQTEQTEASPDSEETAQTAASDPTEDAAAEETTEPKEEEDILNRDYLESDQSNGRMDIWRDYISIYQDVGVIGLSPGYYMSYIYDHYPDLYIVDYIRQFYPAKYQSGIIFHVHSGYLMVYVSAGIAGLLLLAAFVVLCLIRVGKRLIREERLSDVWICSFVIVLAVAISAVFDEGIFFQNNPQTTLFWLALGVLMKESAGDQLQAE